MKNLRKPHPGERGAALIFVLGVLALLMLMGVAFLSSMLLQRQTAETASRRYDVETLAQSAVNRALAIMRFISTRVEEGASGFSDLKNFNRVVSTTGANNLNNGGSAADFLEVDELYKHSDFSADAHIPEPEWIYVRQVKAGVNSNEQVTEDDPIVGRFAFAVVPDVRPQINLNAAWGKVTSKDGSDYEQVAITSDLIGASNTPDEGATLQSNVMSCREAKAALELAGADSPSLNLIMANLITGAPATNQHLLEYYWVDDNHDGMVQKNELFRRFNLLAFLNYNELNPTGSSGYDADVVKNLMNGTLSSDVDSHRRAYYYANSGGGKFDSSVDNQHVGLAPFFNKFTSSDKGTFSDLDDFKRQIVANLVDYTAGSGNKVTSDVNPDYWGSSNKPKYTGNKKTCYINEVGGIFSGEISVDSTGSLPTAKLELYFTPYCEIVDMYGGVGPEYGNPYKVTMDYTATIEAALYPTGSGLGSGDSIDKSVGGSPLFDVEEDDDAVHTVYGNAYSCDSNYYVGVGSDNTIGSLNAVGGAATDNFRYEVTKVSVHVNWVKLEWKTDGTNLTAVDFAHVNKTFEHNDPIPITGAYSQSNFSIGVTLQTDDPRQNLNSGDWKNHTDGLNASIAYSKTLPFKTNDSTTTLGYRNKLDTSGDHDSESYSDIAGGAVSTAYIRESKFNSLWELGAVSRARKWQTINLKKANANANGADPVGGDYDDGDAELLDFVYLDVGSNSNFKFNINARDVGKSLAEQFKPPWEAFFNELTVNGNYTSPSSGEDVKFFANTSPSSWLPHDSTLSSGEDKYAKSRSEIAEHLRKLSDGATDASQESLYGKAANLLEASNGFFQPVKLLVVAQTIRDVGGDGQDVELTAFTSKGKTVTRDCRVGTFDCETVDGETVYFDRVTSSEKLLVTIQRNLEDGSFIITSIDRLD